MPLGTPAPGLARTSALAIGVGTVTVLPGFLVGVLSLQIRSDLDVSLAAAAAATSVFFAAGVLGSGLLGRAAQRAGALTSMRIAAVISGTCMIAIAVLATSLPVLLALLVVAGLANSGAQPAINLFLADEVPRDRQGLAFGIKQSAVPGSILVSGLALPALALPFGWRPAVAVCGGLALAMAAVLSTLGGSRPIRDAAREAGPRPSRALVLLAAGAALATFGPNALGAHMVGSAVDAGISEAGAGLVVAVGSAASLAVRVAFGHRADRRSDHGLGVVALLLGAGSVGFAVMASGEATLLIAGGLVAFGLGWGWPGLFNLAVVAGHRVAPAAATGVTQTGIYIGAAGGPAACGLLAAHHGYPTAWGAMAAITVAGAAVMGLAGRARKGPASRAGDEL